MGPVIQDTMPTDAMFGHKLVIEKLRQAVHETAKALYLCNHVHSSHSLCKPIWISWISATFLPSTEPPNSPRTSFTWGLAKLPTSPMPRLGIPLCMQAFYGDPQLVAHTTMYAGTHGAKEANQAIAEHISALLGKPEFSDQNVLTYNGAHNAIHGVVRTCVMPLGSPYDERQYVLVPTPCYPYFPTILNLHSGVLAYVAYSADELVEGIETYVNPQIGVIVINTPNNPLGFALNRAHVERINRAVAPYNCVLAVDMVYALAANNPQAIGALAAFDPERTIYVDSFSKKFGLPGFRLGYIATANPELLRALRMMKASESIASSTVKALFGAHLLRHHTAIAEATSAAIQSRYSTFRQAIEGIEEYGIEVPSPAVNANAFYLPLFLDRFLQRTELTDDDFNTICRDRYGLEMVSGTRMYPQEDLARGELTLATGKARISSPGPVV